MSHQTKLGSHCLLPLQLECFPEFVQCFLERSGLVNQGKECIGELGEIPLCHIWLVSITVTTAMGIGGDDRATRGDDAHARQARFGPVIRDQHAFAGPRGGQGRHQPGGPGAGHQHIAGHVGIRCHQVGGDVLKRGNNLYVFPDD